MDTAVALKEVQENIINFRPIQQKLETGCHLYRSTSPHVLKGDQVRSFLDLGIKTIIDMRTPNEWENHSELMQYFTVYVYDDAKNDWKLEQPCDPSHSHMQRNIYRVDFYTSKTLGKLQKRIGNDNSIGATITTAARLGGLLGVYKDFIDLDPEPLRHIFQVLAHKKNCPALFHCSYGKDRTGVVAALLESCLGCSEDYIIRDYSKSQLELGIIRHEMLQVVQETGVGEEFVTALPETMRLFINYIKEKYGGIDGYFSHFGIPRPASQ